MLSREDQGWLALALGITIKPTAGMSRTGIAVRIVTCDGNLAQLVLLVNKRYCQVKFGDGDLRYSAYG